MVLDPFAPQPRKEGTHRVTPWVWDASLITMEGTQSVTLRVWDASFFVPSPSSCLPRLRAFPVFVPSPLRTFPAPAGKVPSPRGGWGLDMRAFLKAPLRLRLRRIHLPHGVGKAHNQESQTRRVRGWDGWLGFRG